MSYGILHYAPIKFGLAVLKNPEPLHSQPGKLARSPGCDSALSHSLMLPLALPCLYEKHEGDEDEDGGGLGVSVVFMVNVDMVRSERTKRLKVDVFCKKYEIEQMDNTVS